MIKNKRHEMRQEWSSWEPHIREDLERLEYRLQKVYSGMAAQSIPRAMREAFVLQKLAELIEQVSKEATNETNRIPLPQPSAR